MSMLENVIAKGFDALPPSVRHSVVLLVVGAAIAALAMFEDGRVSAAEQHAKDAIAKQQKTAEKIDQLGEMLQELRTKQSVTETKLDSIQDASQKVDGHLDRLEDKLDAVTRALIQQQQASRPQH